MDKTEFRIDEVKFGNGEKQCYIFYKSFNLFGFPKWKLYFVTPFKSIAWAEEWLKKHIEEKELKKQIEKIEPYVTDSKLITI